MGLTSSYSLWVCQLFGYLHLLVEPGTHCYLFVVVFYIFGSEGGHVESMEGDPETKKAEPKNEPKGKKAAEPKGKKAGPKGKKTGQKATKGNKAGMKQTGGN